MTETIILSLTEKDYNEKCDVYSFTIIAWELMIRQLPYFHLEYKSIHIMLGVTSK